MHLARPEIYQKKYKNIVEHYRDWDTYRENRSVTSREILIMLLDTNIVQQLEIPEWLEVVLIEHFTEWMINERYYNETCVVESSDDEQSDAITISTNTDGDAICVASTQNWFIDKEI